VTGQWLFENDAHAKKGPGKENLDKRAAFFATRAKRKQPLICHRAERRVYIGLRHGLSSVGQALAGTNWFAIEAEKSKICDILP
jgi:hypothetical protein